VLLGVEINTGDVLEGKSSQLTKLLLKLNVILDRAGALGLVHESLNQANRGVIGLAGVEGRQLFTQKADEGF